MCSPEESPTRITVGFTLDLFPDPLHHEMNESEEVGRHTCAIVVLVCGDPTCERAPLLESVAAGFAGLCR